METGKTVRIVTGDVALATGEQFPRGEVTDGKSAMRAAVMMILKHTADMFTTIVGIVAEKYELDEDEMMKVIQEHPRFTDMLVDPVLHDLGYLERPAAEAPAVAEATAAATEESAHEPVHEEAPAPASPEATAPESQTSGEESRSAGDVATAMR